MKSETSGKASGQGKPALQNYMIYGLAVVVVILAAAIFIGSNSPPPAPPANASQAIDSEEAKLLLSAFDRGAELKSYHLKYAMGENGDLSNYTMANDGRLGFARVEGVFGSLEGYFTGNDSADVVCLTYNAQTKCAVVGNNTNANKIAGSLRALLPSSKTYLSQKDQTGKLIRFGSIVFEGGAAAENIDGFSTKKISYSLDYRNLTLQQLAAAGIPADDPGLANLKDQKVSFWIDDASGLVVRSLATYSNQGRPMRYEMMYYQADVKSSGNISLPNTTTSASNFFQFYQDSEQDFIARESCRAANGTAQTQCYKSLAYEKEDSSICGFISDLNGKEECVLIIAQETGKAELCGSLAVHADDCYINLAGQTGNYELCKKLANVSRSAECAKAATEGIKALAAQQDQIARLVQPKNCETNQQCGVFGASSQYCAPKNTTQKFDNQTSVFATCFANATCGCAQGYCAFDKNEEYYACINRVEEGLTRDYIINLVRENDVAKNETNSSKTK